MVDGEIYHIEPQAALVTTHPSHHLIYRESDSLLPVGKCGELNYALLLFLTFLCVFILTEHFLHT